MNAADVLDIIMDTAQLHRPKFQLVSDDQASILTTVNGEHWLIRAERADANGSRVLTR